MNVYSLKPCLTILFLVQMLQALSFWMAVTPRSLGLSVIIEEIRIVITNSETCLIRGHYSYWYQGLVDFFYGIWSVESRDWSVRRLVSEGY